MQVYLLKMAVDWMKHNVHVAVVVVDDDVAVVVEQVYMIGKLHFV